MTYSKCIFLFMLAAVCAFGQDKPAWSVGGIKFGGLVDGYASINFQKPPSQNNSLIRVFDTQANTFALNMAKLSMSHDADPVGFTFELGFGRGFEVFNSLEPVSGASAINRNIEQAFITLAPPNAGGFKFDFGKFVTSAGAEPTETHLNWNYSRSLIYALGPFYHFGVRLSKPVNEHWTTGLQVVNGWNNTTDNNTGKTIGIANAFTSSKVSLFNTYYVGPEKSGTNENYRHFVDTVLSLTPHDMASFYLNYDYGYEKSLDGTKGIISAIAGAAMFRPAPMFGISPRIEFFNDRGTWTSGAIQKLKEFTLTAEIKHSKGFMTKIEYRRDWSNIPYFETDSGFEKSQNTFLVGFIAYFGE